MPHTVVFDGGCIFAWYFTSKGVLLKKQRENSSTEAVIQAMCKVVNRSPDSEQSAFEAANEPEYDDRDPVAYFIDCQEITDS